MRMRILPCFSRREKLFAVLDRAAERLQGSRRVLAVETAEGIVRIPGNLFANAIEASMALPKGERLIREYMDMRGPQLYISFTNFTATKKLKKSGNVYRTTKGESHGFGLVRIDAIVERLGGYLSRNSEDGAFTTEILLPQ